jgi:hypothetical protein
MGKGDYALQLVPEGRAEARKRGELNYIEPGETKKFHLEIGIVEGKREFDYLQTAFKLVI